MSFNNNYQSRLGQANQDEINPIIDNNDKSEATDAGFGKIFVISLCITFLLSLVAFIAGNPHKLSNPIDPDGRPCGQDELQDYPYIYFATPSLKYLHRTVCVKKCEELTSQPEPNSKLDCYPNSVVKSCQFHISNSNDRNEEVLIYDTKLYLNKICMPLNVGYFKLITDALQINKMDQILSDIRECGLEILLFGIIAFGLSYLTKYIIDSEKLIPSAINTFFGISTVGFLALGVLFLSRGMLILTTEKPNDKDVVTDISNIGKNVDKNNSSFFINICFAVFCFINCGLYIKQYIEYDHQKDEESKQIVEMRNKMLSFISDVIRSQNIIFLPLIAFGFFFLSFALFIIVEMNVFSIGSTQSDERGLPFESFKTNPIANILAIIIFVGFFWIFIFIIQASEYIVYSLSLIELGNRYENRNQNNYKSLFDIISQQFNIIQKQRIGTIALCSILQFAFYYPRAIFEWIDTNYQRKITMEKERIMKETFQSNAYDIKVEHTAFMNFQKWVCTIYETSFLKAIQPYGFIYTINKQQPFLEAGKKMQENIDSTSFWFEDMLDGGELFENQIKYSICFFVSLCFLLVINSFDQYAVSSVMVPLAFMTIVSYVISLLYVNMYGSIYSTFIIYYLEKEYRKDQSIKSDSNINQLNKFRVFVHRIVNLEGDNYNNNNNNNKNNNNNNNIRNLNNN